MVSGREAAALIRQGIFAVNKPSNVTSGEVLSQLRDVLYEGFEEKPPLLKLGHGGTLDREAVGVLVVGVNWGCKKLPLLLKGTKNYVVVGQLGIATDTYNDRGRVMAELPYGHVREPDVAEALKRFTGEFWQSCPVYSTLRVAGRRSDVPREGYELRVKERKVRCYSADCTDFNPPFFTLQLRCGGAFYARSFVHDIGVALNTCALVRQLQRTQQGPFTLLECLTEPEWTFSRIIEAMLMGQIKFSQYESRLKRSS